MRFSDGAAGVMTRPVPPQARPKQPKDWSVRAKQKCRAALQEAGFSPLSEGDMGGQLVHTLPFEKGELRVMEVGSTTKIGFSLQEGFDHRRDMAVFRGALLQLHNHR